jgi:hypothetical protein
MWHHFETNHHQIQISDAEYILSTEITRKKLADPAFLKSIKEIGALPKSCKTAI